MYLCSATCNLRSERRERYRFPLTETSHVSCQPINFPSDAAVAASSQSNAIDFPLCFMQTKLATWVTRFTFAVSLPFQMKSHFSASFRICFWSMSQKFVMGSFCTNIVNAFQVIYSLRWIFWNFADARAFDIRQIVNKQKLNKNKNSDDGADIDSENKNCWNYIALSLNFAICLLHFSEFKFCNVITMLFSRPVADDDAAPTVAPDDGCTLLFIIDAVGQLLSLRTIDVDRFADLLFFALAAVDALLFFGLNGAFWNTIAKPLGDGCSSAPCTARQRRNMVRPMINLRILQSVQKGRQLPSSVSCLFFAIVDLFDSVSYGAQTMKFWNWMKFMLIDCRT